MSEGSLDIRRHFEIIRMFLIGSYGWHVSLPIDQCFIFLKRVVTNSPALVKIVHVDIPAVIQVDPTPTSLVPALLIETVNYGVPFGKLPVGSLTMPGLVEATCQLKELFLFP